MSALKTFQDKISVSCRKILALSIAGALLIGNAAIIKAEASSMSEKGKAVKVVQTAGRDRMGDFAPDFDHYNDDILFGEVWSKNDVLPLRERSMITISALIASGVLNNTLRNHIELGKKHGITREEIVELITQTAFYGGWTKAWAAFIYAKEVYGDSKAE